MCRRIFSSNSRTGRRKYDIAKFLGELTLEGAAADATGLAFDMGRDVLLVLGDLELDRHSENAGREAHGAGQLLAASRRDQVAVVEAQRPMEAAVEETFVNVNPGSTLKLGQARGAALAATFAHPVAVHEYAPREVKLAVVGTGAAEKVQVQKMVTVLLGLKGRLGADAADALAIGLCHIHRATPLGLLARRVERP